MFSISLFLKKSASTHMKHKYSHSYTDSVICIALNKNTSTDTDCIAYENICMRKRDKHFFLECQLELFRFSLSLFMLIVKCILVTYQSIGLYDEQIVL